MAEKNISGNVVDFKILQRLFRFVRPYRWKFIFVVVLTIMLAVLAPIRPKIIQYTIDERLAVGDMPGVINMIVLMIVLLVLQFAVLYFHTYLSGWLGQYIIRDIRIQLFNHIQRLQLRFFDKTPIGRLVTRNISDIETLAEVFSQGIAQLLGDLLQLFVILGVMFYMNWKLTLISLSTLPVLIFCTYIFKEKIKAAFNEVRTAVANLNTFVQEHITGMNIVQVFNNEEREYEKFRSINHQHRKANLKSVLYYSVYFPVAEVIQAIAIGLIVWFGAKEVINDEVSPGLLIAFIMYIQMFFRPIRMIADRFNTLQMGIVSSNRIFDLLDNHDFIDQTGSVQPTSVKGDIKFDKVWFAYNEDDYVLRNINFEVKSGQTVALVGETGAGKSSTINLLSRLYEINKGHISLDGEDINDYDISFLRSHIGVVLQDVFLFSDTIEKNITLGNEKITEETIMKAAELIGAKDFISKLPGGLQYNVMERGATLSVGQRQMISFLRAMVYDPKVLILDEATSSVDTETEELIQSAISNMMKGRTALVIAHRLSTIQDADKIIVFSKGEIMEEGSHDELLKKDGYYSQLHQMQYKQVV